MKLKYLFLILVVISISLVGCEEAETEDNTTVDDDTEGSQVVIKDSDAEKDVKDELEGLTTKETEVLSRFGILIDWIGFFQNMLSAMKDQGFLKMFS